MSKMKKTARTSNKKTKKKTKMKGLNLDPQKWITLKEELVRFY